MYTICGFPLSHSFGKVLQSACIRLGTQTTIDGRVEQLVPNLAVIKPTFLAAVPRVFEKVYNKVIAGAKEKAVSLMNCSKEPFVLVSKSHS